MSRFGDMAGGAREAHTHFFADSVTLTEPGSVPRSVAAVPGKVRIETRTDEAGRQQRVSVRTLRFTTLTEVRHDATITIDGQIWAIDGVQNRTASGLTVELIRVSTHQVSRPSYRGKP